MLTRPDPIAGEDLIPVSGWDSMCTDCNTPNWKVCQEGREAPITKGRLETALALLTGISLE